MPEMKLFKTERGFEIVTFRDAHGEECSLQCSSAIGNYPDAMEQPGTSFVWLGRDDVKPRRLVPNEGWQVVPLPDGVETFARMHLSREQVGELIRRLHEWLRSGTLALADEEQPHA